ncbi:MAG TPA: class I SAM-dependent methyltransferase [Polyangiaceae bacterium]|nr:class I SAM-dependent methyltransferase [Polyangiaceae bacterium]
MDASGSHESNRAYYDAFSSRYEAHRGGRDPGGYHDLVDELESELVERFGRGKDVLEVGCGTGLVLSRIARFARSARGVDLSPGMLAHAQRRGLDVALGSATELPFPDSSFDVVCSFKVLAHVKEIDRALSEMARVTRPGGHVIAEFYNPWSLRGLAKRFGPRGEIAAGAHEGHVFTRYDSPEHVRRLAPVGCTFVAARGIRIVTPFATAMRLPVVGPALRRAERALADSPLSALGGFYVAAFRKAG